MPYQHLTESQRNVIFYLDMMDFSKAEIGRRLGRHRSTILRELRRNRSISSDQYLPDSAQIKVNVRRQAWAIPGTPYLIRGRGVPGTSSILFGTRIAPCVMRDGKRPFPVMRSGQ